MKRFKLGRVLTTRTVCDRSTSDFGFYDFLCQSIARYRECDWGDICREDWEANDRAVEQDDRTFAVYRYPQDGTKIWIITEWDRSATTILFPDEY